jgi:glutamine amidotransferase
MRIGIIDLGFANINSVTKVFNHLGFSSQTIKNQQEWSDFDKVIFPGVGNFRTISPILYRSGLAPLIQEYCSSGKHFLGICLGMHLLCDSSEEGPLAPGLCLIPGAVKLIKSNKIHEKIPHNGWNQVNFLNTDPLFKDISVNKDFYFNHSYSVHTENKYVIASTPYSDGIVVAIRKLNTWGVQFHPEKSQQVGIQLIKNFVEYND